MKNAYLASTPEGQKILVYRFGQIGDTVAAVPALWALRRQFPEARMVLLSEVPAKSTHLPPEAVLPAARLMDGFEKYPAGTSVKNVFAAWRCFRQLRKQGFQTVVYLVPTQRTRKQRLRDLLFFRLAGINRVLAGKGFTIENGRKLDGSLTTQPHEADALLARLGQDGVTIPPPAEGCMDLGLTPQEHAVAQRWWDDHGRPLMPQGWVAICPGAKFPAKLWPLERYAEVGKRLLQDHGVFPVIVGGPEDRRAGHVLLGHWGAGLCAAGELSVRESAALMSEARLYLGNDTGVMHLAAAVGSPCVAVFSARDWPGKWEPYGAGHRVIRHEVPCAGCRLEVCDRGLICLTNISAQDVYQSCLEVLAQTASRHPAHA